MTSFAIAIPAGHWHPVFPRMLQSLATQTAPLQVALLDASDDNRVKAAADASGIEFFFRQDGPDDGQAAAIALGWRETTADILGWLNVDDVIMPGALNLAAAAFDADPDLGVFYGGSDFIDHTGKVTGYHDQVADISPYIYRSNIISQPSCFFRRRELDAVGGLNEKLHFTMDWDLWIRLYANGAKFQRTDAVLSQVFMGDGTKTSQTSFARLKEVAHLVHRHAGPWNAIKSTLAVGLLSNG